MLFIRECPSVLVYYSFTVRFTLKSHDSPWLSWMIIIWFVSYLLDFRCHTPEPWYFIFAHNRVVIFRLSPQWHITVTTEGHLNVTKLESHRSNWTTEPSLHTTESWSLRNCLGLVSSLKSWVSFVKEPYKRDNILQKRPIILRSLLIKTTP